MTGKTEPHTEIDAGQPRGRREGWGVAALLLLAVLGGGVGTLVAALALDLSLTEISFAEMVDAAIRTGMLATLDSLAEVLAAVLGISLTVVAIVVQLASARYPAKIVDVFMLDRVNIAAFAFMAASCVYVVCAPLVAATSPPPPAVGLLAILLTILNFGLLLPYFAYVFAFLEPTQLISRSCERMTRILQRVERGAPSAEALRDARERLAEGIERVADNAMAAIGVSDRNLAIHSVQTLGRLTIDYLDRKARLPEGWFDPDREVFGTLSDEFVADVDADGTWVETKALMEYERIIRRALGGVNEVVSTIASSTHAVGSAALVRGERQVVRLVTRFFNTYVRHGLNAGNIRAVYGVLYEYRGFALDVFRADPELGRQIVEYFVYYGRTANDLGLPFATVTAAHDVRVLCESVSSNPAVDMDALIDRFLSLDQPSELKSEEVALIGVRKAQSILGAFFLRTGQQKRAERIRNDMRDEREARLRTIRDEILAVREQTFWEITDRGHNFDYVDRATRPFLLAFFEPLLSETPTDGQ